MLLRDRVSSKPNLVLAAVGLGEVDSFNYLDSRISSGHISNEVWSRIQKAQFLLVNFRIHGVNVRVRYLPIVGDT